MTQERFFELVYAWKDGDLTGDELYQRVFVLSNVVGRSEQLMQSCSVCGTTKHPILGAHCKAINCPHEH